ncbi:TIGR04211 family SH3 domain-containing protein [Vibrio barjaei]|uniref:TIGR04211 family SH3 domain-containing protein n=1 Tax=Vibrio barjaei TaxID=1676683 RepID=A0ABW7IE23_9VIBR|nr:TIGR04211 family SH3 domain-containing protein [Vibrio barjaei]MCY9870245.1 TIGR04211 family SH3 domain-containing protein [Vibrio barjaei]OIN29274.1 arylsulfatase [Vibrio barjaei]
MKKLICMIMVSLLAAPAALAQDRYIADKLFTYLHSGPSSQYRIIGSINAGDKVRLLSTNRENGYSQVQDSRGRKGWVETKYVTTQESMAVRLPRLEKELTEAKSLLANARETANSEKDGLVSSLEARNKQIAELEQNYSDISSQLTSSQTEIRELRAKLDTQKEDLLLRYFMYGGGVAGAGLLFGLILPHIIPRRKKSPNGWA